MNVLSFFDTRIVADTRACMRKLTRHAEDGTFTGIAFIGYIEGRGWIADVCGYARHSPLDAKDMLPALDAKLTKLAAKPPKR